MLLAVSNFPKCGALINPEENTIFVVSIIDIVDYSYFRPTPMTINYQEWPELINLWGYIMIVHPLKAFGENFR